jgi:pyruvate ferredoxin oxidoreductase gamma subunit
MYQVRLHGRGGQGVVTAAELLAAAAIADGLYAQAFPSFGSERTGAPVAAYCRIDGKPIRSREPVADPDAVLVLDPTLLRQAFVVDGLRPGGTILINAPDTRPAAGMAICGARVRAVPATQIARERIGRPLPNAAMVGAFAATGVVTLASVRAAIAARFPAAVAQANVQAAADAYEVLLRGADTAPVDEEARSA